MQKSIKTLQPLRWLAVILLASTLFIACENKDTKKLEPSTEIEKEVKDSLPPLNTDSNTVTKPETIKNLNVILF